MTAGREVLCTDGCQEERHSFAQANEINSLLMVGIRSQACGIDALSALGNAAHSRL
jgi:hypothetical protein